MFDNQLKQDNLQTELKTVFVNSNHTYGGRARIAQSTMEPAKHYRNTSGVKRMYAPKGTFENVSLGKSFDHYGVR